MNKEDFYKVPIGRIILSPKSGACVVLIDRYWVVVEGHVLFFGRRNAPQCHDQREIALHLAKNYGPEAEVEFIHKAFIPLTIYGEYDYNPEAINKQYSVEDGKNVGWTDHGVK